MTGLAFLLAPIALAAVIAAVHAARRRRRGLVRRPMALANAGGRAFAEHVWTLSDFRVSLEPLTGPATARSGRDIAGSARRSTSRAPASVPPAPPAP